jgi:hypothetical protein
MCGDSHVSLATYEAATSSVGSAGLNLTQPFRTLPTCTVLVSAGWTILVDSAMNAGCMRRNATYAAVPSREVWLGSGSSIALCYRMGCEYSARVSLGCVQPTGGCMCRLEASH